MGHRWRRQTTDAYILICSSKRGGARAGRQAAQPDDVNAVMNAHICS